MRSVMMVIGMAAALAGCATGPTRFPVQTTRFHFNAMTNRGTIAVEPLPGAGPASIEYKTYAAAVQSELLRLGYANPAPGATPQFLATVAFTRAPRPLPPRRSPVSIGIGGGGISGGRGGGVGLGGGVSFPVGGSGGREGIVTELSVRIRQGPDAVWEGQAQSLTDAGAPDADAAAIAERLARALFAGFPGESGRTIEVP
ncbi:hypothetical protein [Sphingomonas radiodurans]|uniref:hypothetical protein n=1 Tax=Sphingomonas radiodurans TaxID=2890321 RepID=UPI001E5F2CA8|nr:hypothetical protein [Sphingomonas radiodurans]WBH17359.1 hypothetical protein LLW23_04420 [Sphingomonas radiodurans]